MRLNKQKAYERSLEEAREGNVHPVLTCVRLSRDCNLICDYCSEIYIPTGNDLHLEDWKKVVDISYNLGCRDIVLSGGEPLLKPYVVELVQHTASRDAFVSIATNGLLLNKKLLSELNDASLDYLCISVDSLNNNGRNWGKNLTGKLRNILEHIGKKSYGFETQISTVVTRSNLLDLPQMVKYFSSLGISTKFMVMMRNEINEERTNDLSLTNEGEEVRRTVDTLLEIKEDGALLIDNDFTLSRVDQFFSGEFTYNCEGGAFDLSVNNDGRLVICPEGIISSTNIFGLNHLEKYRQFIENSKKFTDSCGGCLWSYKQRLEESIQNDEA